MRDALRRIVMVLGCAVLTVWLFGGATCERGVLDLSDGAKSTTQGAPDSVAGDDLSGTVDTTPGLDALEDLVGSSDVKQLEDLVALDDLAVAEDALTPPDDLTTVEDSAPDTLDAPDDIADVIEPLDLVPDDLGSPSDTSACIDFAIHIETIVTAKCVGCHQSGFGGFTLTGNVDADYSAILPRVDTTTPANSLFYTKGSGVSHSGGKLFSDAEAGLVLAWITAGAPKVCLGPDGDVIVPDVEHVDTSEFDVAPPTCGSCHKVPPPTGTHLKHTDPGTYNFDCSTCHPFPESHQNGSVQVEFTKSIPPNPSGSFNSGSLVCSGLYCHSNGKSLSRIGSATWGGNSLTCESCHPTASLSGRHDDHLPQFSCNTCHSSVTASNTIADYSKHVNGVKDYDGPLVRNSTSGRCSGKCHTKTHESWSW